MVWKTEMVLNGKNRITLNLDICHHLSNPGIFVQAISNLSTRTRTPDMIFVSNNIHVSVHSYRQNVSFFVRHEHLAMKWFRVQVRFADKRKNVLKIDFVSYIDRWRFARPRVAKPVLSNYTFPADVGSIPPRETSGDFPNVHEKIGEHDEGTRRAVRSG